MLIETFHAEDYPPGGLVPALAARARELVELGLENVSVEATASPARIVAYRNDEVVRVRPSAAPVDIELRVPVAVAPYLRDAVYEARKNYEEDSLAEEPDETARQLRAIESELNRAVFS